MDSYHYLLDLAFILLSTKMLGLMTRKLSMPQVVGSLLAGLVLGPAMFNILQETDFIIKMSEIGVIVLMFTAGLETDMEQLKKDGKASFVIAIMGVLVPLGGGFLIAYIFNRNGILGSEATASTFLQNMFIGIILTATSVSITVETLKELGKLNTRAGNAILGAAIIDDVLGIIGLTVITSMSGANVNVFVVLLKVLGFFVFSGIVGFIFYQFFKKWTQNQHKDLRRFVIVAFVLCLGLAYFAEEFFGVADITGAFVAGLIISNSEKTKYIANRFDTVSYALLSPVFFASIGLKVAIPKMTYMIVLFAVLLTVIAILSKVIGCGIGAKLCSYTNRESVQIGAGMVSRGEVALIVVSKGATVGLISNTVFGPIIIVVLVTTIVSPILLKIAFHSKKASSPLVH